MTAPQLSTAIAQAILSALAEHPEGKAPLGFAWAGIQTSLPQASCHDFRAALCILRSGCLAIVETETIAITDKGRAAVEVGAAERCQLCGCTIGLDSVPTCCEGRICRKCESGIVRRRIPSYMPQYRPSRKNALPADWTHTVELKPGVEMPAKLPACLRRKA